MSLDNYDGTTFVSFTDISGFRKATRNRGEAIRILNAFYQAGYDILKDQAEADPRVDGLFVSDCCVLFVRSVDTSATDKLNAILRVVETLNRRLLDAQVMLVSSVAYGPFTYQQRLEFPGIEKNPLFGNAYLDAYLDVSDSKTKLLPGQCRVACRNLPDRLDVTGGGTRLLTRRPEHRYFYWMVPTPAEIPAFDEQYSRACSLNSKLKYSAMLSALQNASAGTSGRSAVRTY